MSNSFNDLFEDGNKTDETIANQEKNSTSATSSIIGDATHHQDFFYCSNCGRKIKADSKFCRFCGSKMDEIEKSTQDLCVESVEKTNYHEVSARGKLEVKLSNDPKVKKSTIANEIVATLKMICFAFLLWGTYMICFICYHSKDVAPVTETSSYFGESCYDEGLISGSWEFSWEKHLARSIAYMGKVNKYGIRETNPLSSSEYLFLSNLTPDRAIEEAQRMAHEKNISQEGYEQLVEQAKVSAKRDRESFNQEISDRRKWAYEDDLHNHMLWSALIALGIFILGRYLILSCRWVANNKT